MAGFTVDLDLQTRRRLFAALTIINVGLAVTTSLFILAWAHLQDYPPAAVTFIKHVLVQGHLATENVLAAWYSSMLLLSVALSACLAFAADRRRTLAPLRWGWLLVGAAFVTLSLDEIGSFHERIGMVRALSPSAEHAVGWVWVFAIPIAVVAMFLLGFAWLHVRRAPGAFWWMAAGVTLFAADPVFETAAGAITPGWIPDLLLVLEEGGLELFGILCFLVGILTYVRFAGGERLEWSIHNSHLKKIVRGLTAVLAIGAFATTRLVRALPESDGGIPANWFPAATFFLVAVGAMLSRARWPRRRWWATGALALSGYCGAGLYGYSRLLNYGHLRVALIATVIGGWMLEGTLTRMPSNMESTALCDRPDR